MTIETSNPGALAGTAGAKTRRIGEVNDATNAARRQARAFAEARDMFIMRVIAEPRATEAAVKIAVAMAVGHANRIAFERDGILTAWPSMRTIADKLGMFRGRVARALSLLEEIGLITVVRPDKRGATHHNQYVLHPVASLEDKESGDGIGLTSVANSGEKNGLMVGDNIEAKMGVIGLSGEDAMASPVSTKSIEEPLDGAGAHNARPAPIATRGSPSVIEDDLHTETHELAALDAPPPASDRSASVPMDARPFSSEPDGALGLIPVSASGGEGADLRGQAITMADLDRIAADEREAAIMLADEVRSLFPKIHDADRYVSELRCGFTQCQDDLAAARATTTTLGLLMGSEGHEAATRQWRSLLEILSRALQSDQILAFRNAVAAAMVEQRTRKSSKKEAAHA